MNDRTEKEIRRYIVSHELEPDDYLVYSRKHDQYGDRQPITRTQAYRVLREAGEAFGIDALGTHTAEFVYKCTDVYDPTSEGGIPWNDESIGIDWPKLDVEYKTSAKDEKHEKFADQSFKWAEKWE